MSAVAVILPVVWATESLRLVSQKPAETEDQCIPHEMAFYSKIYGGVIAPICAPVHGGRKGAVSPWPGDVSWQGDKLSRWKL